MNQLSESPTAVRKLSDHNGANASLARVSESIRTTATNVAERTKAAARNTDQFVHEHPWASVSVVMLLGAAAGYLYAKGTRHAVDPLKH
jgi:ElaB/YqjD/DUF883 family membrane-anchored ribosome-binding protein